MAIVCAALAGCAPMSHRVGGVLPYATAPPPLEIVIDVAPFEANRSTLLDPSTAPGGVARGLYTCLFETQDPLSMVLCLPIGLIGGGIAGFMGSEFHSPEGEAALAPLREQLDEMMAGSMREALGRAGIDGVAVRTGGPAWQERQVREENAPAVESALRWHLGEIRVVDSIPERNGAAFVIATEVAQRRAGSTQDDRYEPWAVTEQGPWTQWRAEGGEALRRQLDAAFDRIAAAVIEDAFLTLRAEPDRRDVVDPNTLAGHMLQDFMLRPVSPSLDYVGWGSKPGWIPARVAPNVVTLRWEAFPRRGELASIGASPERVASIRYDVRLFRILPEKRTFPAGSPSGTSRYERGQNPVRKLAVEQRFDDLQEPELRLSAPLEPCTLYGWTVRSRFMLDGRPRALEWSSLRYYAPIGKPDPWRTRRRAGYAMDSAAFATREFEPFPFRTNATAGSCPALNVPGYVEAD